MPKTPNIILPDTQFSMEQSLTATDFFERVLGMEEDQVLYGDDTLLSDLAFSGDFPEVGTLVQQLTKDSDMGPLYDAWDRAVLAKLREVYSLELSTTCIALPALFESIHQASKPRTLQ
jgi:hypothetical protein